MRNIIWCISTGYEHFLPGAPLPKPLGEINFAEESTHDVLVFKGQSVGISSAIMPPYAFIPKGIPYSEFIKTRPELPSK